MRNVTSAARRLAAHRKRLILLPCIAVLAAFGITTAASAKKAASATKAVAAGCTSTSTAKYNLVKPNTLTVAVVGAAQPFVSQNASGTAWVGLEPDLVHYVAKQACIKKVVFVEQEFSSLLADVANRKYDIGAACIGDTVQREQLVNFTRNYLGGYISFVGKAGSTISSVSGLAGKHVGVVTGSVEETYLKTRVPAAQAVEFPDSNTEVQALLSGQIDAAFLDSGTDETYIKQYPQLALDFRVQPHTGYCGWPISKKDKVLLAALNRGMNKAINSGFVTHLFHKWLPKGQSNLFFIPGYKPKQ